MGADILLLKLEDHEQAEQIALGLREAGIHVMIEKLSVPNSTDLGLPKWSNDTEIYLKIANSDLEKARQVILAEELPVNKERNYLLPYFSDDELKDVIAKPELWGAFNHNTARTLLEQREEKINKIK